MWKRTLQLYHTEQQTALSASHYVLVWNLSTDMSHSLPWEWSRRLPRVWEPFLQQYSVLHQCRILSCTANTAGKCLQYCTRRYVHIHRCSGLLLEDAIPCNVHALHDTTWHQFYTCIVIKLRPRDGRAVTIQVPVELLCVVHVPATDCCLQLSCHVKVLGPQWEHLTDQLHKKQTTHTVTDHQQSCYVIHCRHT